MNALLNFEYLDDFLKPISGELPCGLSLGDEGDEKYLRVERDVESATDVRDWVSLKKDITPLLQKTKDFRLLAFYARTLVNTEKTPFSGLTDALLVARSYIQNNWNCSFPIEDVEDDDDRFTDKLNAIGELGAWTTIVLPLKKKRVLLNFKGMQEYSLTDLLAFQQGDEVEGKQPPKQFIKALAKDELEQIETILASARLLHEVGSEIKALVAEKIGESFVELDKYLLPMLDDVISVLEDLNPKNASNDDGTNANNHEQANNNTEQKTRVINDSSGGKLTVGCRDDVVMALDLICEYYHRQEPSSPLPLLLKRARGIVHKDFLEVLEELVPDSVSMTEPVFGRKEEENDY